MSKFGFRNPTVYPASSLKGLLSKLIQSETATESQIKDFKHFFSAEYAQTNEDGDQIIPAPRKIASTALQDSGILEIQTKVFATIIQSAGWNLLDDVLGQLDKSAHAIEDTLKAEIAGWKKSIKELENQVKEYSQRAETARKKLESVKANVNRQQVALIESFGVAIDTFAKVSKRQIQEEIENVVAIRQAENQHRERSQRRQQKRSNFILDIINVAKQTTVTVLDFLPVPHLVTRLIDAVGDAIIEGGRSLADYLNEVMQEAADLSTTSDPYRFRFSQADQAKRFHKQINDYCVPHLQDWWASSQDRLVREGTQIREELVEMIRFDVQEISDELSSHLGEALEVDFNINPIQFPSFNFNGIDNQIEKLQERYTKVKHEKRRRGFSDMEKYEVPIETHETRSVYEIDLKRVLVQIHQQIDESSEMSQKTLKRVIEAQIRDDFRNAQKQLEDYINRFDQQLKRLLEARQFHEENTPEKIAALEEAQAKLRSLLSQLKQVRKALKCQS